MATGAAALRHEHEARFLLAAQGDDGLWRDFLTLAGESTAWPTGFVVAQLAPLLGADHEALRRAGRALVGAARPEGGWGYHVGVPRDSDSTAWAVLALASWQEEPAIAAALEAGLEALCAAQRDDGGVPTYERGEPIARFMELPESLPAGALAGWTSPHVEVTATVGRALLVGGAALRARAEAAWRFVKARQEDGGGWRSYWWTGESYPTLQAVQLGEALGDDGEWREAAREALRARQRRDGGYATPAGAASEVFETAQALSAMARLGRCAAACEQAHRFLVGARLPDGGWPTVPIMRIPPPHAVEPPQGGWDAALLGAGALVRDHRRAFTTAACLSALAAVAVDGAGSDAGHSGS